MDFGTLAVVVAAGLVGPLLASSKRWAPPVIVGEIAAGVTIGTGGLHWVKPDDPVLAGLGAVGFALLMFVVGTHLPVRDPQLRRALVDGAGVAVLVALLAGAAGRLLAPHVGLDRPAILAVLLATSSGAVALPVLHDLARTDRAALVTTAWVAIADVLTVLALPVVLTTGNPGRALAGGTLVAAAGAAIYLLARLARDRPSVARMRALSHERGWGLDLRVSLLALFTCAWLATRFGTSILIAGFAVGATVAFLGEPRRVALELIGVGEGFLIPVFFVHLGAQLDVRALLDSRTALTLAVTMAMAAVAVHVAAATVWRLPLGSGLLASAQLGVPAAVVSIGIANGSLTPAQAAALMASMLVSLAACAVGSVLLGVGRPLTDASAPLHD